jgi:hypothetical protein
MHKLPMQFLILISVSLSLILLFFYIFVCVAHFSLEVFQVRVQLIDLRVFRCNLLFVFSALLRILLNDFVVLNFEYILYFSLVIRHISLRALLLRWIEACC